MALHPKIIDLSLDRVHRLLTALGNPEQSLPPVVHVAGTNGKGSVIAFLRAMLESAGHRIHAYTSPHLVRFNERIVLDGAPIGNAELTALLEEAEAANAGAPITYFEITTAAAFLAFARHPADVLLLEVGLGGRLDATNVVDRPLLSIITPVSIDHQQYLGDTLTDIANEKAGILKPGVPAVIGPQEAAAHESIAARAAMLGAPLFVHGRDWAYAATADGFRFTGRDWRLALPAPGLAGGHQIANAATAVAALEALPDLPVTAQALRAGIVQADWPARMQTIDKGPLAEALPEGWRLMLDGGHNEAAGRTLAEALAQTATEPVDLIVGMIDSKRAVDFLRPLAARARRIRTVTIPDQAAAIPADDLAAAARGIGADAIAAANVPDAMRSLIRGEDVPGTILICGSLYLAGHVLAISGA